jgi:hypothetical protein
MTPNAVAHVGIISALTIKYGAVSATARRMDTISGMLRILKRYARNGRKKMADEYIRREDVSNWLKQYGQDVLHGKYKFSLMYIWKNIMDLPSADVAPVVHSRWIKTEDGAECENCGREAVYQIVDDHWEYENFCPHCGARMDGENKDV